MRLDHVVIVVPKLAGAIEAFRALGFTVTPGGEHEGLGTHNALIALEDDSYLELIAFRAGEPAKGAAPDPAIERRVRHWAAVGPGLVDFAVLPGQIVDDVAQARRRGLAVEGPLDGGRRRPDGQQVAWQFAFPDGWDLPFLCGDVTPRPLRVPTGPARQHANGAAALLDVTVALRNLEQGIARYTALLGYGPEAGSARFRLGGTTVSLVAPRGAGDDLHERLAQQGDGPLSLRLLTRRLEEARVLDPQLTGGASIELVTG